MPLLLLLIAATAVSVLKSIGVAGVNDGAYLKKKTMCKLNLELMYKKRSTTRFLHSVSYFFLKFYKHSF